MAMPQETEPLSPEALAARRIGQRRRAVALGLVLGAIVVLFYVLTIFKLGGNVITSRDL